jgi:1,4-alpha-glucan branching enzyme
MVKLNSEWVEFVFYRPQARQVHLVGEFNGWRENELPMSRTKDGYWQARMRLPVGEFRFRYCADGEWFADYAAFGVEPGRFGMDSIVRVPQQPLELARSPEAVAA